MNVTFHTDIERFDFDAVSAWLSDTYWSPGITKEEVVFGARNSALVVGGFDDGGRQVSYARVVSDKVRFAYLLDVIVAPELRRRAIGTSMVRFAMESSELSLVYQWLLKTGDAHGVYAKVGFTKLASPDQWMTASRPRGDRSTFRPRT